MNIVSSVQEDFYDPRNKTVDFMRSSEWKAGYRGKKDILRKGDQIHNRQTAPVSWEENLQEQQGGKTLRVYDFDDTLAVTRGANIKVKHEDGTIDTLNPAEFAVYQEQPGDKFDFTEFDRVIKDAEPIQNIVSMLRKDLETTAKVTILTARLIAYPVRRYLKSLDLDAYVVAVGSSDPQDKAKWIENHIEKGYSDILFIDDSEKNRNAVSNLKDKYPDIKLDVQDPDIIKEYGATMNNQELAKHNKNLKRLKKDLKKFHKTNRYHKSPTYLKNTHSIPLYENKYYIDNSNIQGIGAFADNDYPAGTIMGKLHDIPNGLKNGRNYDFYELGKSYNHSDNPNCENLLHNNTRYLVTIQPIKKGEELTANYRLQPELEQPEHFLKEQKEYKPFKDKPLNRFVTACRCNTLDKFGNCPRGFIENGEAYFLDCTIDGNTPKIGDTFTYPTYDGVGGWKVKVHKVKIATPHPLGNYHEAFSTVCGEGHSSLEENVFTKNWWEKIIKEQILIIEGGAPGHMAHPFDLDNVNSGKDLIEIMRKSFKSLQETPGSVKIDGTNTSVRLIDVDGEKQFAMDRGSKKDIDVQGITKDDLEDRFKTKDGSPHGMVAAGGKVLDLFNGALPYIENDLKKIGSWDNSDLLFNTEYVSGKTNVQEYDEDFLAIHNVKEMKMVEEPSEKTGKPLIKRKAIDVDVDSSTFQSLIDNFNEYAQTQGFKIYGQVATEVIKEPAFNSALSTDYIIKTNKEDIKKSLQTLLDELDAIPKEDRIFMNVNNTRKDVGAVSKMVYTTILDGGNVDELFPNEEDKELAIKGFTTYLATEMLGQEILKVLDSPMGTVDSHEGVVIKDKNIANTTFKLSGAFIRGGLETSFR